METSSIFYRITSVLAALLVLGACEKPGEFASSGTASAAAPSGLDGIFDEPPDLENCVPGRLSEAYQKRFVRRLNQVRALHGIPALAITESELGPTQEAALVIVANARINHHLDPDSLCYTDEASRSSNESLLLISAGNEVGNPQDPDRVIRAWLQDTSEPNLGHRRWLLDPFVTRVAYGFVHGEAQVDFEYSPVIGATLDIIDGEDPNVTGIPDFVAFPQGLYPSHFVNKDGVLSFALVPDPTSRAVNAGKVFYSEATVSVSHDGTELSVTDVRFEQSQGPDTTVIGIPNVLMWRVEGLQDGVSYTVMVDGVLVDEEQKNYTYEFTLF